MPELPEVESARRLVEKTLCGKTLATVTAVSDPIVFDRNEPQAFRALAGRRVVGTGRKGKYLWIELDERPWIVLHLGMTGDIEQYRQGEKTVRFLKMELISDDGSTIAMSDPRRFGRIRLAQDPLNESPLVDLGYDPLLDFPKTRDLVTLLARRKAPIKAVLLDQGVFAGVGNWIADEVLFQARIKPSRLTHKLSTTEVATLRATLLRVIKRAVAVNADSTKFPRSWLFHHRWGKAKDAKTASGQRIVHATIGGRTTAWVPAIQK